MTEIIAMDGPAGSGKSSVSKEVARRLGYGYLDTGAAYRALAWAVSEGKLEFPDDTFKGFDYAISLDPNNFWVRTVGEDVTDEIRLPSISEKVSLIAAIPSVRNFMKALTLDLVSSCGKEGVVVEGRDITTVVAPAAKVRILLTADESVRLERRSKELSPEQYSTLKAGLQARDASDSKVVDFMTAADGVTLVDSTNLDFQQTVDAVLSIIGEQ
jgi:cytidylate kinase